MAVSYSCYLQPQCFYCSLAHVTDTEISTTTIMAKSLIVFVPGPSRSIGSSINIWERIVTALRWDVASDDVVVHAEVGVAGTTTLQHYNIITPLLHYYNIILLQNPPIINLSHMTILYYHHYHKITQDGYRGNRLFTYSPSINLN